MEGAPPAPRNANPLAGAGLIAAMAFGSIFMWLGVPLILIYIVSSMVDSTQPTMGPYLVILFGLPAGMAVVGKTLGWLDRVYGRVTGKTPERRQAAWMRSMRGERPQHNKHWSVLDVVMVWSVSVAGLLFGIWFFAFAGSSLPGA